MDFLKNSLSFHIFRGKFVRILNFVLITQKLFKETK